MPILKGRAGELGALSLINEQTKSFITPLIEVIAKDAEDMANLKSVSEKLATSLGERWVGHRCFIDAAYVGLNISMGEGGPLRLTTRRANDWGVKATPVIRLDDPDLAFDDVRKLHAESGQGVCVRLLGDDLDRDPDDLQNSFMDLAEKCELGNELIDVLIDAGAIESDSTVRAFARMARSLVRDMEDLGEWRTVTVAAGAFPVDLSAYVPGVIGERGRFDADMWAQVVTRGRLARTPHFGDYAVGHPLLGAGAPFSPPPQLRYTVADKWLILKGTRRDPLGHKQFHNICDAIAEHPEFVGAALGQADERIANSRRHSVGNATTWRQLGTAHHLDLVTKRLTTLGEP